MSKMSDKQTNAVAENVYVALLRGINIGGHNLMKMPKLKESFEKVGLQDVSTYINTGNIIFRKAGLSRAAIVAKLEEVIRQDFQLDIKVLLRSHSEFKSLIDFLPPDWVNNSLTRCDIMFLWEDIDEPSILAGLLKGDREVISSAKVKRPTKKGAEHLYYVAGAGAVVWHVNQDKLVKCHALQKLAANKLYKRMTLRNVNSARKIYALLDELANELGQV